MKASDLRVGTAVNFDGKLYICVQAKHVTPGNLRAFVQAKLRSVADGIIIEKRFRSTEELEQTSLDRREMEYLYSDGTGHILMDTKTYDQTAVSDDLTGESIKFFRPNTTLIALVCEGNIVAIEVPKTVELTVAETTPAIKGATATNQMKEAVLETGLKTRVPPFVDIGDVVRISTDDASYLARAK